MLADLAALMAPHTPDDLTAQAARRQVRAFRGIAPEQTAALLPWEMIEALKTTLPAEDFYLGFRGGQVPPAGYRDADGTLRPTVVQAFLDKGATLLFNNLERHAPAVAAIAQGLAQLFDAEVVANAYLTFGPVSVFHPHRDPHHVLAVQIHGAKNWRLYGKQEAQTPAGEELLEGGDLLFVPKGEYHDTLPRALPSVHISFGFSPPRRA